jgi:hypothetical protein
VGSNALRRTLPARVSSGRCERIRIKDRKTYGNDFPFSCDGDLRGVEIRFMYGGRLLRDELIISFFCKGSDLCNDGSLVPPYNGDTPLTFIAKRIE